MYIHFSLFIQRILVVFLSLHIPCLSFFPLFCPCGPFPIYRIQSRLPSPLQAIVITFNKAASDIGWGARDWALQNGTETAVVFPSFWHRSCGRGGGGMWRAEIPSPLSLSLPQSPGGAGWTARAAAAAAALSFALSFLLLLSLQYLLFFFLNP
jgi:hypothetical protein